MSNFLTQRRFRRVRIPHELLNNFDDEQLFKMFKTLGFVVVTNITIYNMSIVELIVTHKSFESIKHGVEIPLYDVIISLDDGKYNFKWGDKI